jgi:hypothetical protein
MCSVLACPHAAGSRAPTLCADAVLAACRLKGTSVNVAHARSEANEKRKRTLLQEYRRVRAGAALLLPPSPLAAAHWPCCTARQSWWLHRPPLWRDGCVHGRRRESASAHAAAAADAIWQSQPVCTRRCVTATQRATLSCEATYAVVCIADDGDEEVLTHLGSSLAELDADDFVPSDGVRSCALALARAGSRKRSRS